MMLSWLLLRLGAASQLVPPQQLAGARLGMHAHYVISDCQPQ
jgi:hypothetical protein